MASYILVSVVYDFVVDIDLVAVVEDVVDYLNLLLILILVRVLLLLSTISCQSLHLLPFISKFLVDCRFVAKS